MAARKLNKRGRILVREHLMAGCTNEEVRQALIAEGHRGDLSDPTFFWYRSDSAARAALAEYDRQFQEQFWQGVRRRHQEELEDFRRLSDSIDQRR